MRKSWHETLAAYGAYFAVHVVAIGIALHLWYPDQIYLLSGELPPWRVALAQIGYGCGVEAVAFSAAVLSSGIAAVVGKYRTSVTSEV